MPPAHHSSPWPQLLPTALAGTRRHPLAPLPGLTPSLGSETDAPEKTLLLTAANLRLVQRAGQQPTPNDGALAFAPAAEVLPATGPAATALLTQVLGSEQEPSRYWTLLHFLRLLGEHQQRLPHRLLLPLFAALRYGGEYYVADLLRDGAGGLGNRGPALLLALGWQPLSEWARQPGTGWQPGVPATRQSWLLGELARRGPHGQAAAMAGLFEVLAKSSDWEEHRAVWRVLRQWTTDGPLPPEAGPLLDALVERPGWVAGSRKRLVYIHDLLGLRAAMPDSDLTDYGWQLARQHLHLDAGPDGRPCLRFEQYPGSPADYHSRRLDQELDGWLGLVPPSRWAAAWHLTSEQAVAAAAATERGAEVVLPAWVRAAATFRDSDFLAALAHYYRRHLQGTPPNEYVVVPTLAPLRDADLLDWLRLLAPELPLPPDVRLSALHDYWRRELDYAASRYSPALLRGLLPLLVAGQQPSPHPEGQSFTGLLAYNLNIYFYYPDSSILPALQAALESGLQPKGEGWLTEVVAVLQAARDFEAALLAPAGR